MIETDAEKAFEPTKGKVAESMISVSMARAITYVISFASTIVLARIFDPFTFGIFGIVLFILSSFWIFRDFGLSAALIQRKEITQDDLRTAFTIQEIIIGIMVVLIFLAAPLFVQLLGVDPAGRDSITLLIRALSITLLISSFGVIPSILLEKKLEYKRLVIPDIVGVIINYSIVMYFAHLGYGIWSLVPGMIVSGIISVILLFVLSPWRISIGINKGSAKGLLRFGIPFSATKLFPFINNAGIPVIVGMLAGIAAIGYLNLAYNFGHMALGLLLLVDRILFPTYSRLRDNMQKTKKAVEKTIRYATLSYYPIALIMLALSTPFVHFIYSEKWLPILPAYYLIVLGTLQSTIVLPVVNLLFAAGKPRIVIYLHIMWTSILFGFGAVFVYLFGFVGWPLASLFSLVTLKYQITQMNRIVKVDIVNNVEGPIISAFLTMIIVFIMGYAFVTSVITMVIVGIAGMLLYLVILWLLEGRRSIDELMDLARNVKSVFLKG